MIANARMYSVSPAVAALWRSFFSALIERSGVPMTVIEHAEPTPIDQLWARPDKAAVFMCGLPFARAQSPPILVAAPVPSAAEFGDEAQYSSAFVVRADSACRTVEDTLGGRIAFTTPESQSGYIAALSYLMSMHGSAASRGFPLYREVIAPTVTPLGALEAVIDGAADVAPIDAYAWRLLLAYRPELTCAVRVVGRTAPTPIPPLVASRPPAEALPATLVEAHHDAVLAPLMRRLLLRRFARVEAGAYAVLRDRYEAAMHYWRDHELAAATHPAFVTQQR